MTPDPGKWLRQAGAIPVRDGRVCLVTSRRSAKRWVVPKGAVDPGHTAGEAAIIEAWEEAGLTGHLTPEPIGSFVYEKLGTTCHVTVFVLYVSQEADEWPEKGQRERIWLEPNAAAEKVTDAGLAELIRGLEARLFATA